jgi:sn-1 stearoyl-lipid 9-desaturase
MRILRFNNSRENQTGKNRFNWLIASFMTLFHVGAVSALFFFTWNALFVAIFLYWVVGSLGIGMGYHRLLTHRGYKTPKWVEYFLTVCAVTAVEGGPLLWVATHRIHHQFSDEEGDPHSPRDGKWWAHVGWILVGNALRQDASTLDRYVPDLAEDKFHVWITEYHFVPTVILGLALFAIGGLPFLLWGIFLRTVVGLHSTWLVNSATHLWGSRRFETRDRSTNSWWVALLTFGEGWHNNHHAHPVSAQHGLKWYEVDFNWYGIWVLKKLGLASHVYRAKLPTYQQPNEPWRTNFYRTRRSSSRRPNTDRSRGRDALGGEILRPLDRHSVVTTLRTTLPANTDVAFRSSC